MGIFAIRTLPTLTTVQGGITISSTSEMTWQWNLQKFQVRLNTSFENMTGCAKKKISSSAKYF